MAITQRRVGGQGEQASRVGRFRRRGCRQALGRHPRRIGQMTDRAPVFQRGGGTVARGQLGFEADQPGRRAAWQSQRGQQCGQGDRADQIPPATASRPAARKPSVNAVTHRSSSAASVERMTKLAPVRPSRQKG